LREEADAALAARTDGGRFAFRRYARMRFQWQLHELEIRLPDEPLDRERMEQVTRDFVEMYGQRYGEAALLPGARLEIVSLRLEPAITMGSAGLDRLQLLEGDHKTGSRPVWFTRGEDAIDTPTYDGDRIPIGEPITGPAVVDLAITGIVLPPGTTCERRPSGDFLLTIDAA
jgi:N-methylhydantoinase A